MSSFRSIVFLVIFQNDVFQTFVIRHSSFVIRHSSFVIRHSSSVSNSVFSSQMDYKYIFVLFLVISLGVTADEKLIFELDADSFDSYVESNSDVIIKMYTPVIIVERIMIDLVVYVLSEIWAHLSVNCGRNSYCLSECESNTSGCCLKPPSWKTFEYQRIPLSILLQKWKSIPL